MQLRTSSTAGTESGGTYLPARSTVSLYANIHDIEENPNVDYLGFHITSHIVHTYTQIYIRNF
jgi:hypothetical protein